MRAECVEPLSEQWSWLSPEVLSRGERAIRRELVSRKVSQQGRNESWGREGVSRPAESECRFGREHHLQHQYHSSEEHTCTVLKGYTELIQKKEQTELYTKIIA